MSLDSEVLKKLPETAQKVLIFWDTLEHQKNKKTQRGHQKTQKTTEE
jgi:heme-degrading monooxygenase HmoA